ncbi:hypothetical protein [Pseudarthrobacter sp. S6]|uniref:hypothetical protein n=1 Tax=Pseudarthrobacter sp. S6 TaxID=3418420 RepID=UPI003CF5CBB6
MSDYYDDLSPFDEEVEGFKAALRESVKQEVQEELKTLRESNTEMSAKLAGLHKLEREAEMARRGYEVKLHQAEATARRTVEKEGLRKLLAILKEPRFKVTIAWDALPKCDRCAEDRKLHYTTPRGRKAEEACECSAKTRRYTAEEVLVHEVAKRNGKILAWYSDAGRYFGDDDSFGSPTVLKSAENVALAEMVKDPHSYGFTTLEDAQKLAVALNEGLTS